MKRSVIIGMTFVALAACRPKSEPPPLDPVVLAQIGGAAVCADYSIQQDVYNHATEAVNNRLDNLPTYDRPQWGSMFADASNFTMDAEGVRFTGFDEVTRETTCELPIAFVTENLAAGRDLTLTYTVQPNAAGTDVLLWVNGTDELDSRIYANWTFWVLGGHHNEGGGEPTGKGS